jgi:hypothetical protein
VTRSEFELLLDAQLAAVRSTLAAKREEYAPGDDVLANFARGAAIAEESPARYLWCCLSKHLASLAEMTKEPTAYDATRWREKVGDAVNYLLLLEAMVHDTD